MVALLPSNPNPHLTLALTLTLTLTQALTPTRWLSFQNKSGGKAREKAKLQSRLSRFQKIAQSSELEVLLGLGFGVLG